MSDQLLFTCRVCGCETDTHPLEENQLGEMIGVQGVCPDHCEDHDYEYDRDRREHYCVHCDQLAPDDYLYSDDDVGFGYSLPPAAPVGIPASEMNGNAAARHDDPEGWANWVAFCNANGLP